MIPISEDYLIAPSASLKDALKKIDKNTLGTVFLIDNDVFIGTVTDGDIRRVLLKESLLDDSVSICANIKPFIAVVDEYHLTDVYKKMDELQIRAVPVIDKNRKIVGIISTFEPDLDYPVKSAKVFIMAGGFGTRLDPFTKILPKPLIPFGDKTIIEHIMDNFYKYGFRNFTLSLFYKGNIIKTYFNDSDKYKELSYVEEQTPLGTGGSLKLMRALNPKDSIMVANCDSIININFDDFYNYHLDNNFDITILGLLKHIKIPYGVIKYDESNYLGMDEKPAYDFIINTGFYILKSNIIQLISDNEKIDMPELIERAKAMGKTIGVFITSSDWFDIGQWDEYRQTVEHFKKLGI